MSVNMQRWPHHEHMGYYQSEPWTMHPMAAYHLGSYSLPRCLAILYTINANVCVQLSLLYGFNEDKNVRMRRRFHLAWHGSFPMSSSFSTNSKNLYYYQTGVLLDASSNRHMRNMAEKMRRDKLNFFINELSTLVPIISFSPKKLDKTSILRLAATYIRLNNVIFGSRRDNKRLPTQDSLHSQMIEYLPQNLASFNWSENVLEEMDGMLLIVNGAGRIIFISHTVEKLLGHTQIELMGQSLYNLTCLEDYDELKRNLTPDEDFANSNHSGDTGPDESSSDSSSAPATPPIKQIAQPWQNDDDQKLRRSFYIRLRQRAQSRSDQPQYELVHIIGHLRVPQRRTQPSTSHQAPNHNDIILVSVVKPFKEKRITTLSLIEACREEFITRHTLDGRIIYTDHRISIVAGYLSEEVCGVPGFQYMHKEDMRWTMVGLRHMFFRGSSYGQSCYRLQSKNGTFIYLKTCGYLELSESNDSFQSLICINSLVSPEEGEALIRQMKEQFSPVIKNKNDRNMEILSSNIDMVGNKDTKGETEDPKVLEAAITQMISNVPTPASDMSTSLHSPSLSSLTTEPQFAKATLAAKAMPPLSIHIKKIGIVPPIIRTPAAVAASLSPPSSHHSPPPKASPPPPPPVCLQQNRPSVLRVAHKQGDHVVPPPDRVSVLKIKRMRTDESGQEVVTVTPAPRSVGVVVSPSGASSGSKRKSEDTSDWPLTPISPVTQPPPALPVDQPPPPLSPHFQLESVDQLLTSVDGPLFFDDASPPPLSSTHLEDIGLTDMYGLALSWGQPEIPEMLETSHRTLDSRMQLQEDQIHEIEQELVMVPQDHTNGQVINSKLTQLQEEHRKQQQILRTLQQDHQNIQHLGVCNNQQNVGV